MALKKLYDDKEFLPAFRLQDLEFEQALGLPPVAPAVARPARRAPKQRNLQSTWRVS